jgi:hypothetical protein
MNDTVNKICVFFEKLPTDIAKKKYGKLNDYTYEEVILRVLTGTGSTDDAFPEMSHKTVVKFLAEAFPGKKDSHQSWRTYLLDCVQLKRCGKCLNFKALTEFNVFRDNKYQSYCTECNKQYQKTEYADNSEYYLDKHKVYRETHKPERAAQSAKRRANKLQATPNWSNLDEIKKIYQLCPSGAHVDHEIPLQGDLVCGLHVEHNLQYLIAGENLSKSNKFNPDTYVHKVEYMPPYITNVPHLESACETESSREDCLTIAYGRGLHE